MVPWVVSHDITTLSVVWRYYKAVGNMKHKTLNDDDTVDVDEVRGFYSFRAKRA